MHWSPLTKDVIVLDLYHDTGLGDLGNFALESSIVNQDARAKLHSLTQLTVVCADAGGIALDRAIDHDLILLTSAQFNWLTFLECAGQE